MAVHPVGRSGIVIVGTASPQKSRLGVEIYINNPDAKQQYRALLAQRADIESKLGLALDWQELPDAHACRVVTYRFDCPLGDETRWDEYLEWMEKLIIRFDDVFRPVVRALP